MHNFARLISGTAVKIGSRIAATTRPEHPCTALEGTLKSAGPTPSVI